MASRVFRLSRVIRGCIASSRLALRRHIPLNVGARGAEPIQHISVEADVDIATLGQYLQPRRRNLAVAEYVTPQRFDEYREFGLSIGFKMVFSGPLVRSSYMADLVNEEASRLAV